MRNLNEEINRIKSLFNNENLYGNLITEQPIGQAVKRLLKYFDVSDFKKVDLNDLKNIFKRTGKVLSKAEEAVLSQYLRVIKSGKNVKLLEKYGDKYIFEFLPEGMRYDAVLKYVDDLEGFGDVAKRDEVLGKMQKYFADTGIKPKNIDEFDTFFKRMGKSLGGASASVDDLMKKLDDILSKHGAAFIDEKQLEPALRKILKEYGLTDKIITNKSAGEVVEQSGLSKIFGRNNKKVNDVVDSKIVKPTFLKSIFDYTIPFVAAGRKYDNPISKLFPSLIALGLTKYTLPVVYSLLKGKGFGLQTGYVELMKDLYKYGLMDLFEKYITGDFCTAFESLSGLGCKELEKIILEEYNGVIESIKEIDSDFLCEKIGNIGDNGELFQDLFNDKRFYDQIVNRITPYINKNLRDKEFDVEKVKQKLEDSDLLNSFSPQGDVMKNVAIKELTAYLYKNTEFLTKNIFPTMYNTNPEFKKRVDDTINSYRQFCATGQEIEDSSEDSGLDFEDVYYGERRSSDSSDRFKFD